MHAYFLHVCTCRLYRRSAWGPLERRSLSRAPDLSFLISGCHCVRNYHILVWRGNVSAARPRVTCLFLATSRSREAAGQGQRHSWGPSHRTGVVAMQQSRCSLEIVAPRPPPPPHTHTHTTTKYHHHLDTPHTSLTPDPLRANTRSSRNMCGQRQWGPRQTLWTA